MEKEEICEHTKGNRVNILVEDERQGDGKVEDGEALGTDLVGQNLDGVGDDERSEGDAAVHKIRSHISWHDTKRRTRRRHRTGR